MKFHFPQTPNWMLGATRVVCTASLALLATVAQAATSASWSMNDGGNLCSLCVVNPGATETEVTVTSAVTSMTLDLDQFNAVGVSDTLNIYDGTTLLASLDTSLFTFTDLAVDSTDFSGARLFQNFSYLRSGYLAIQSDLPFDRLVFSGDDTLLIADMSGVTPIPEPSMALLSLLGLGALFSRRASPTRPGSISGRA